MASSISLWKRLRFRIEALGVRAMARILPVLPRKGLLHLAHGLSFLAYRIDRRGRGIANENLRIVFPDKDAATRTQLVKGSYFHQTKSALDLMWAPRNLSASSSANLVKYTFEDRQDFETIGDDAAIWVTPHYGTFEWLSMDWSLHHDKKPLIVAEDFRNPALTPIFTKIREYSGITIIPQERAMMRLLKHVKRGGQTAFLTDLRVKPSKASTIIECFGFKTSVTILHAFLAKQTGAPVIPVICLPQSDGTYHFHFHRRLAIGEDATPQEIAQQCWDVFEHTIRDNPAPWMWMYKHWRYLPKDRQITYPSYASHSKAFAKVESELENQA
ncbi:lysophospholipid acyltransferase family protein [Verrucomicrobiales bacterium]|nr:lysophospholipid acyltransferase family protein [Verrucomicrobiales bacterium]MDB4507735.1 lysophospholipid acyltransferase family protein [bacterium]MDF1788851.1 lysophospholipid acyltransferase family protein [Verrucomicrobiales bacterium]NCF86080.1 hypothetical protein [Verrucomicrobiaceae bacterium]NCF93373.1 hypothetical protein [Verrucomicrobiaceae bacterium]